MEHSVRRLGSHRPPAGPWRDRGGRFEPKRHFDAEAIHALTLARRTLSLAGDSRGAWLARRPSRARRKPATLGLGRIGATYGAARINEVVNARVKAVLDERMCASRSGDIPPPEESHAVYTAPVPTLMPGDIVFRDNIGSHEDHVLVANGDAR